MLAQNQLYTNRVRWISKLHYSPVSNIDDLEPNPIIIALRNKHGEMRKSN